MNGNKPVDGNELNDSLDDLLGGSVVPNATRPTPPETYKPMDYSEPCRKCGGSGRFRNIGPCFACKGKGKLTFKTSPQKRAAGRVQSEKRRERAEQEKFEATHAWSEEHKAEVAWLAAAAMRNTERGGTFDFPAEMLEAIAKYSSLTEKQLAAVRRLMVRDEERARAREAEREVRKANAPTVDVSKIEAAFAHARERAKRPGQMGVWTRPLTLRSGDTDLTFRPGSQGSQWEGMIFVKNGDRKLGHVAGGKFVRKFECTDAEQAAIVAVCADPHAAAVAHAKAWSRCGICGQTLTNDESIERGIGPICAEKYGW